MTIEAIGKRQDDPVIEITVLLNGQKMAVAPARVAFAVHALIERGEGGVTPLDGSGRGGATTSSRPRSSVSTSRQCTKDIAEHSPSVTVAM